MTKTQSLNKIKAIIWDWNGTLLNDLEQSIHSMNQMLEKRNYPLLEKNKYKEIFTFPVKDYYIRAGVNFKEYEWDVVAMEFIDNYRSNVAKSRVHDGVGEVLKFLAGKNMRQFILSAMQQEFLTETIRQRLDAGVFEDIVGLNNHYAHTKLENAFLLIEKIGLPKNEILMFGDTLHDFEVAEAVGISCILFSGGHQSRKRLMASGALVIDNLAEIKNLF
ncbi:MAG: HAD family hydrolase [Bacteroidales bacterium]|nr:HAD family hydrolase [Bacteroidales bacterium]